MRVVLAFFAISLLVCCDARAPDAKASPNKRIAVIGAGIAGASAALFLKDKLNTSIDITVFEASDIAGGRVRSVDIDGDIVEAGAGIGVRANKYLVELAERCGLTLREATRLPGAIGVWNGSSFVVELDGWSALPTMLFKYGVSMPLVSRSYVLPAVQHFAEVYDLQNRQQKSFRDVADLWKALNLYQYTQETLEQCLLRPWSFPHFKLSANPISKSFVDEFVTGIVRINYNQSPSTMNALAGLIGLTPLVSGSASTFDVVGGNVLVVEKTLKASKADIKYDCRVKRIQKEGKAFSFETMGACEGSGQFDAVVLATPIELSGIEIDIDGVPEFPKREFQQTITTFVIGKMKPSYFGVSSIASIPSLVATVESDAIPFSSIGSFWQKANGERLVKIFSREPMSDEVLGEIFEPGYSVRGRHRWSAYPRFTPPEKFSKFELADKLYYINGIETGASALEVSLVGAKNVALLIANDFGVESSKKAKCSVEEECQQREGHDEL